MKKFEEKDEEREHRIDFEVIVDCYDEYEQAMGWETYLGDKLDFPFKAKRLGKHGGRHTAIHTCRIGLALTGAVEDQHRSGGRR